MALPAARVKVTCGLCGQVVHPLVARYLWLAVGWRGRPSPKPHTTDYFTFCGPCADTFLVRVTPFVAPARLPTGAGS